MTLSWMPGDNWHIVSACGKFTISKVGTVAKRIYLLWRRPLNDDPACHLGTFDSARDAKDCAQQLADREVR